MLGVREQNVQKLPDNLKRARDTFSEKGVDGLFSGETLEFAGVTFVSKYAHESTAERFCILKSLPFIEHFVQVCSEFEGGALVELGIAEGGSTALLALALKPSKLVAVDLEPERLAALDEFIDQRGLSESVVALYGVDQSDASQLRSILAEHFDTRPLDLVLDDASHKFGPTRASFEVLFPHLRPGGVYTIEDWNTDLTFRQALAETLRNPKTEADFDAVERMRASIAAQASAGKKEEGLTISALAIELVLACALSSEIVADVTVNQHWIIVRRGPAQIDPLTFRLENCYGDYFGYLGSNR